MDLRVARQIANLTQAQLAERAGVDAALISRLERGGRRRPSYEAIVRIARALNLAPDDLFPVSEVRQTKGTRHAAIRVANGTKGASR
jgi:transcriptional regulator with XRE-family HTH domain